MAKRKKSHRRKSGTSETMGTVKDLFGMVAVASVSIAGIQAMTGALKK